MVVHRLLTTVLLVRVREFLIRDINKISVIIFFGKLKK